MEGLRSEISAALVSVSTYLAQEPGTEPGGNILGQNIDFKRHGILGQIFAES
jgi:hypothetical protein